jgi:hypothetical protein
MNSNNKVKKKATDQRKLQNYIIKIRQKYNKKQQYITLIVNTRATATVQLLTTTI